MQLTLMLRFKLDVSKEQKQRLLETAKAYTEAVNFKKIEYKAKLYYGIQVEYVDPSYTSQTCPVCGFISKDNRPSHGEKFVCQNCGYGEQADIVGAINIALRVLSKAQEENLKGLLVSQLNAPLHREG